MLYKLNCFGTICVTTTAAMCIEKLSKLGFSEKEAQVYLMLFRMGPSPASALAQRLNLKRVTVYAVLDALAAQGFVNSVNTDQGRRYIPHDPSRLLEKLEEERGYLEQKMQVAAECIQELESPCFPSISEIKRVHFHEGLQAVRKGLEESFLGMAPLNGLTSIEIDGEAEQCLNAFIKERSDRALITVFHKVNANLFSGGSLLVQNDTVGFLVLRSTIELMIIKDPFYAQYVKHVLLSPYFSKNSVGASISKSASVKG